MRLLSFLSLPLLATGTQAALRPPYVADANTLHLYQFDESAGAVASANLGSAGRSVFAVSASPVVASPAAVSTILGAAGAPGFGFAANLTGGAGHLLGYDGNGNGSYGADVSSAGLSPDRVTLASLGINGASPFTLEALIRPTTSTGTREIICTDSSATTRGFQFRLNVTGSTQFLDFNLIGTGQQITANLPASGLHAYATGTWFHVALVYTGTTAQFYWTALDASVTAPNPVGARQSVTLSATTGIEGPLVLGNENRNTAGESLAGYLDQVRISNVARAASDLVFTIVDTDNDGLPDDWETAYFGNLDQTAGGDFDGDGKTNLEEFQAGTDPTIANSPTDTDGDGLPDAWEIASFGNLAQTPAGDFDGDGASNAAEFAAGSAPNNAASTPADTDADGLPDAWERTHFSSLAFNAGDDPDRDHFSNLQEYLAGTSPVDAGSRPAGTAVKLVPVDDGNQATSEFGYAGSSAINSVSFVRSSLQTVGNQQFMTWYGRHQYNASAAFNNTIWIGRRTLGSSHWEVFRHPTFTANTITDGHDVISFGIDGEGYMHLSWGMHGDAFHYSRSTAPVTGSAPIALGADTTMTGEETTVTYPQFLRLPDGDLLFLFREGYSGNGNTYLNRYHPATKTWAHVHTTGGAQAPFIKGMWAPVRDYNAYVNMPQLGGPDGNDLILTWSWRYLPVNGSGSPGSPGGFSGYQTNNMLNFARSPDAGVTWQKFDGTPYVLPISKEAESGVAASRAEVIQNIPEGYSLINQASMCLDSTGNPVTATWWAPDTGSANYRRQYMVHFRHDNGTWQARAISSRTRDPAGTRYDESAVRNLGRPIVVRDDADRIIVAYRDNQGTNGLTIVHSLPRAEDPDRLLWVSFDLTTENLGNYEPIIDNELWDRDRQLHFLYQASEGEGFTAPANLAARISVLEWDAADYFLHSPQPRIETVDAGAGVRIFWRSEPSWTYRLQTSTDLVSWTVVETRVGNGTPFEYRHTFVPGEPKRFWRLDRAEGGF